MSEVKVCKIYCLSEAISPITHMMGTSGNESIINRESILYNNIVRQVPFLSGNALRHKMIREPGALHLVKACDLEGALNIDQANYLFNGGNLTESFATENLARIAEMQQLLPLIRLLGGSLRNQVVGGSLLVSRGILVCEETRSIINKMIPDSFSLPEEKIRFCEDFIDQYQYTRGDALKRKDANLIIEEIENDKTNLMIYSGQSIIPGAVFYHEFILQGVSYLEIGALLNALYEWDALGGVVGGSSRIGHGKLKMYFYIDTGNDNEKLSPGDLIKLYRQHCEIKKGNIVDWLINAFPKKGRKEK